MSLFPNYKRRKRERENPATDVFTYGVIEQNVRVQVLLIMTEASDCVCDYINDTEALFKQVVAGIREEVGAFKLTASRYEMDPSKEFSSWFLSTLDNDLLLSSVEHWYFYAKWVQERSRNDKADQLGHSIDRLNARLLEAGLGYELVDGRIIEKSSEFLHQEATLPALRVLSEDRFANANSEFHEAFEAYKNGEYEDCLVDCLKAFESVMKVIAAERDWGVSTTANASTLIRALIDNHFIPAYMQAQFTGIRSLLESSVPTTRNKAGGHGKGTEERVVPKSLAAFQLHQTAAIIVFLAALEA